MKIITETTLENFEAWSGAKSTKDRIIEEGQEENFDAQIEELYPDGLTNTELNDLLWFDSESVFEWLGIKDEDDEPEEDMDYTCSKCSTSITASQGDDNGGLCDDCTEE